VRLHWRCLCVCVGQWADPLLVPQIVGQTLPPLYVVQTPEEMLPLPLEVVQASLEMLPPPLEVALPPLEVAPVVLGVRLHCLQGWTLVSSCLE
jgi:hypothetical protein